MPKLIGMAITAFGIVLATIHQEEPRKEPTQAQIEFHRWMLADREEEPIQDLS